MSLFGSPTPTQNEGAGVKRAGPQSYADAVPPQARTGPNGVVLNQYRRGSEEAGPSSGVEAVWAIPRRWKPQEVGSAAAPAPRGGCAVALRDASQRTHSHSGGCWGEGRIATD